MDTPLIHIGLTMALALLIALPLFVGSFLGIWALTLWMYRALACAIVSGIRDAQRDKED